MNSTNPKRPGQSRPRDLIDAIQDFCEKQGSTVEVGPPYYDAFVRLDDREMVEMIFDLMRHQRQYIQNKKGDVVANAMDFATAMLRFLASGCISFDEYGRICFLKPIGPEPTDEIWEELDARIERGKPLMRAVAQKLFATATLPPEKNDMP